MRYILEDGFMHGKPFGIVYHLLYRFLPIQLGAIK